MTAQLGVAKIISTNMSTKNDSKNLGGGGGRGG